MTSSPDGSAEGEPVTFGEVFDAASPRLAPGVRKEDLLASLRHAAATGGFTPGATAPDPSQPMVFDLSGKGVHPAIMKAVANGAGSLDDVQAALEGAQQPAAPSPSDPFAELYWDMVRAGIPVASVESILGTAIAKLMSGEDGDG